MKQRIVRVLPKPLLHLGIYRELYRPWQRDDGRRVGVVHGNCQAEPIRRILMRHHGFRRRYRLVRLPPVHECTAGQLERLQQLLPSLDLVITQEVQDDYRGMQLGTRQIVSRVAAAATVIHLPVAYFSGLHPFHVYVGREGDPCPVPAPITDYHDLRILWAAGRAGDRSAGGRFPSADVDPAWVRQHATGSLEQLAERESRLPEPRVSLTDIVGRPDTMTGGWYTINHPHNDILFEAARQVLRHLDLDPVLAPAPAPYLGMVRAPLEEQFVLPLGGTRADCRDSWLIRGRRVRQDDVTRAHLAFYRANPDVLAAGLAKHERRLRSMTPMWLS